MLLCWREPFLQVRSSIDATTYSADVVAGPRGKRKTMSCLALSSSSASIAGSNMELHVIGTNIEEDTLSQARKLGAATHR